MSWIIRTTNGYVGTTALSYPLLRDDRPRDCAFRYTDRRAAEKVAIRFGGTVEELPTRPERNR